MNKYAAGVQSSELSLVDAPATSGGAASVAEAASSAGTEPVSAPAAASEDRFLAKATKEHATGSVDPSLWARAVAQAGGDEALATRMYLNSRATALRVAKRQEKAAQHALVVEVLSNAPDPGFDAVAPEARDETKSKETSQPRHPSTGPNRRRMILVAGVLGSIVVIGGLVAVLSESDAAPQHNVAKPAPPVNVSERSIPSGQTASVAANTGKPAREDVSGEDLVGRVQALEKAGNWNLLVIYAAELTRKQPGNAEAWKQLSQGYLKLRQFGEALDAATKAVQLSPENFLVWQSLGQVNLALQRPAEALLAFQRAAALNDRDVVSLVQEGKLNAQLGHLPDARIAFAKALAVNPEDVQALCGAASIAQKEGRVKDADAMTRQVISLDGRCRDSSGSETVRVVASGSTPRRVGR
ncbi:MAG TPA: tetratricopeptide repeat protein [Casimicrobiaceae bacterium]|jgi:tetratricopeptide (TPR) repeat protein|nr:tetratricopeptide repeat protein [Casimicrobiaceae bacterium]